jgi:hypothetical protein
VHDGILIFIYFFGAPSSYTVTDMLIVEFLCGPFETMGSRPCWLLKKPYFVLGRAKLDAHDMYLITEIKPRIPVYSPRSLDLPRAGLAQSALGQYGSPGGVKRPINDTDLRDGMVATIKSSGVACRIFEKYLSSWFLYFSKFCRRPIAWRETFLLTRLSK